MYRSIKNIWARSISRQLVLGIALVHAILMTVFVTDMVLRQHEFILNESRTSTEVLARGLAVSSTSWVLANDVMGLEEIVAFHADLPGLLYTMILAPDGRVLGHSESQNVGSYVSDEVSLGLLTGPHTTRTLVLDQKLIDVAAPIIANGQLVGWARVATSQTSIYEGLRVVTIKGLGYAFLAILLGSIFALIMARRITSGLRHLVQVAERLKAGDDSARSTLARSDEVGSLSATLNTMIDAVADERERLRVTLNSITDGVTTTDIEGRVQFVNPVAEDQFGLSKSEAIGQKLETVWDIKCDDSGLSCTSIMARAVIDGEICEPDCDSLMRDRQGHEFPVKLICAPLRNSHGQVVGTVLVVRDTSEEQRTQDRLIRTRNLESIGVLAGGIAHDFNNILTAILGNIELAKEISEPGGDVEELLGNAQVASSRAKDLTQQLLTFSRGGDPVRASHSLAKVIQETVSFVLSGDNVRCEFEFIGEIAPVFVDKGQISQVMQNLIINASQAMPDGGVVTVSAQDVEATSRELSFLAPGYYVKLEVRDQGVGIEKETLKQLFDPYFTTKQQGSGLGLAVTHSIISKHGGHISVVSEVGKGAVFTIYLPAASRRRESPVFGTPISDVRGETILIVDDEADIRRLLVRILETAGYKTICASSGAEGVQKYVAARNRGAVALVIMDLTIPGGIGGQEAAAQILAHDPAAQIVVSSGYSNDPVMANFSEHGFQDVLPKPFQRGELLRMLQRVIHSAAENS